MRNPPPAPSQMATSIVVNKPRLWEHLLLSHVLADEFKEYRLRDVSRSRNPIVISFSNDTVQLSDYLKLTREKAGKLLLFQKEFHDRLIEPIKVALGPAGVPGDSDKIMAVAFSVAEVYWALLSFRSDLNEERRVYSSDFPPLAKEMFDEVFSDLTRYIIGECDSLCSTFEKYGLEAYGLLKAGSESLMSGGDGGDYKNALSHNHKFSEFDTSKIERLSMLIDHIAADNLDVSDNSGFVYLLTNESMPGLVKIGHTSRQTGARVRELSTATGVPTPFQVIFDLYVNDSAKVEKEIHQRLSQYRVASNREFFKISTSSAIKVVYEVSSLFQCEVSRDDFVNKLLRSV